MGIEIRLRSQEIGMRIRLKLRSLKIISLRIKFLGIKWIYLVVYENILRMYPNTFFLYSICKTNYENSINF